MREVSVLLLISISIRNLLEAMNAISIPEKSAESSMTITRETKIDVIINY